MTLNYLDSKQHSHRFVLFHLPLCNAIGHKDGQPRNKMKANGKVKHEINSINVCEREECESEREDLIAHEIDNESLIAF